MKRELVPIRKKNGEWMWKFTARWSWWRLTPTRVQSWWVHRQNVRYCNANGHDDTLWHMTSDNWIPPDPSCSRCSTELFECSKNHEAV